MAAYHPTPPDAMPPTFQTLCSDCKFTRLIDQCLVLIEPEQAERILQSVQAPTQNVGA
jgi:hypothetical protein